LVWIERFGCCDLRGEPELSSRDSLDRWDVPDPGVHPLGVVVVHEVVQCDQRNEIMTVLTKVYEHPLALVYEHLLV
jgi:hypothetical protein